MQNKYLLGVCEIFHPNIHGFTNNSYPYIQTHFMVISIIHKYDFFHMSINSYQDHIQKYYNMNLNKLLNHPFIRNYYNIISNINNIKLNIIEIIEMSGYEYSAIIKTFWLKILQRKWKNIYKNKILKLKKMKNIKYILNREITTKNY
jgi:hypothetical protein